MCKGQSKYFQVYSFSAYQSTVNLCFPLYLLFLIGSCSVLVQLCEFLVGSYSACMHQSPFSFFCSTNILSYIHWKNKPQSEYVEITVTAIVLEDKFQNQNLFIIVLAILRVETLKQAAVVNTIFYFLTVSASVDCF